MSTDNIKVYLKAHNCCVDSIYENGDGDLEISVIWGDWKWEHNNLPILMRDLGYEKKSDRITEENGSDSYSAEYVFRKVRED